MSQATHISEEPQLAHIEGRLLHEFPSVSPDVVDTLIRQEHSRFDASPVRSFISLFVEKHAREQLIHIHALGWGDRLTPVH